MSRVLLLVCSLLVGASTVWAQPPAVARPVRGTGQTIPDDQPKHILWPDGAPGALGQADEDVPWMWIYRPESDRANGAAVVVCPGGGYGHLALGHEGHDVANWLVERGYTALVLKYRLGPKYQHPAPLNDVQRAIRTVRAHAEEWQIDPGKVGVWGFSAGGHLASTVSTHFDAGKADAADLIERRSCRPDFAVLAYPVIALEGEYAHAGSRTRLLGNEPDPKLVANLTNNKQVTAQTPPTFLFHTNEDSGVKPENSVLYYLALRAHGVPAELHIYQHGRHGVGLAIDDPVLATWPDRLDDWLHHQTQEPSTASQRTGS